MWKQSKILAVIPAREGSVGITNKNQCEIQGKNLVEWAIHVAKEIDIIDKIVVTTNSVAIGNKSVVAGADIIIRPAYLSQGEPGSSVNTWHHAWHVMEKREGQSYSISVLLEPTSPNRLPVDIIRTIEALDLHETAATVTSSRHYNPVKIMQHKVGNHIETVFSPDMIERLDNRYTKNCYIKVNGACYASTLNGIYNNKRLFYDCFPVYIDRPLANIDEPFDLEYAEWLMSRSH